MPELPEVETIRRGLARRVIGKSITKVEVRQKKVVRLSFNKLSDQLVGQKFEKVERRAKLLTLSLANTDLFLLIHLKMTGQLIYTSGNKLIAGGHEYPPIDELPNKYSHVIFSFADRSRLYFNDMRQFGYVTLVDGATKEKLWSAYGPEPLSRDFTYDNFSNRVLRRSTTLKSVLLNQTIIAGLGNIYVDEICWRAYVRPDRQAHSLTSKEVQRLFHACRRVIDQAIMYGGTTFSDYQTVEGGKGGFGRFLRVYDRAGKACRRCRTTIRKIRTAGRGTHLCPSCQV